MRFVFFIIYILIVFGLGDCFVPEYCFYILNISYTIFVIYNIATLKGLKKWWLNPVCLASIFMFLFAYGVTYLLYHYDITGDTRNVFQLSTTPFHYLNEAMVYASIGFAVMWTSFHSRSTLQFVTKIVGKIARNRLIRRTLNLNSISCLLLLAVSIASNLLQIKLGMYGVLGTVNEDAPIVSHIVNTLASGSLGLLLITSLSYFSNGANKILFLVILIIQMFFSVIAGYKGSIVFIFIILAITYYYARHKLSKTLLVSVVAAIIIAYAIVEPYRDYIAQNNAIGHSLYEVTSNVIASQSLPVTKQDNDRTTTGSATLSRLNFLNELSLLIHYNETKGIDDADPNFLTRLVTFPALIIPRAMWPDKPKNDLGTTWLTWKVLNSPGVYSSAAFGPLGYMYCAGGIIIIIMGCWLIGILLQTINQMLLHQYVGINVIGLLLLPQVQLEADFSHYVFGFILNIFVGFIFQVILLKSDT